MSRSRQEKAASVFNDGQEQGQKHLEFTSSLQNLEKLKLQESRVWWDHTTINKYLSKDMIPRGLRLKKIPTTIYSDAFVIEWNQILSTCSTKLMELIVKHESETLADLSKKLEDAAKNLQEFKEIQDYQLQLDKIEDLVNKQEESIMTVKKSKFQRDTYDYTHNQVYEWGRRIRPTSTTKPTNWKNKKQWKQQRKNQRQPRVNFDTSEPETSEGYTDTSADDTQAASSAQASYFKNKKTNKSSKNDDIAVAENTKGPSRMQTRRNYQN